MVLLKLVLNAFVRGVRRVGREIATTIRFGALPAGASGRRSQHPAATVAALGEITKGEPPER